MGGKTGQERINWLVLNGKHRALVREGGEGGGSLDILRATWYAQRQRADRQLHHCWCVGSLSHKWVPRNRDTCITCGVLYAGKPL